MDARLRDGNRARRAPVHGAVPRLMLSCRPHRANQDESLPAVPESPPRPAVRSPGRVLASAFLWLLAGQAGAAATAFLIAFAVSAGQAITHRPGASAWKPAPLDLALAATVALQAILLFADLRQGRILGDGNLAAGLGAGPVRRRGLIALFIVLIIVWVLLYIALLSWFPAFAGWLASDVPAALELPKAPAPWLLAFRVLLIVGIAPLSEELFFRGWLWTALRRSWGAWPTALCTGTIWLAMHALVGPVRVPILIPAAILLSLARHYGGSVRASLPVHMANNATAMAIQLLALAAGAR